MTPNKLCHSTEDIWKSTWKWFLLTLQINFKQEGWLLFYLPTERASVSAYFGLPWVRPWDNRCKCYIDGKKIQCLSNASQFVPICFPVIQPLWVEFKKFAILAHFLHILASPGYAPGTVTVNVTWMEKGFNAGQTHSSIYPSIFNHLRAIARYWSEIATVSYPPCI